jgi:hypothetical protein
VGSSLGVLQQHFQCKKQSPLETSALVVIPMEDHAMCTPLLANLCCYGEHQLEYNTDVNCWVYGDLPSIQPGVIPFANLPNSLKLLRIGPSYPHLTFIFNAQIADLKCKCLWDSGATKTFIAQDFVVKHGLATSSDRCSITLADGSVKETMGQCKVILRLQKHQSEVHLHVTDLVDGFDVILGNDWSQQQQVEAKFGGTGPKDSHLYLRRTSTRVYPLLPNLFYKEEVGKTALVPDILSAVETEALLLTGTVKDCNVPFLVLVQEKADSQVAVSDPKVSRSTKLDSVLKEYSMVFEQPRFGVSKNKVQECIALEPNARPPNRPAFRLPMSHRQEVEKRVTELLESGGIQPSSSEYGAQVPLFLNQTEHFVCVWIIGL